MESFKIKLVKDGKTLLFADLLGTKEKRKIEYIFVIQGNEEDGNSKVSH